MCGITGYWDWHLDLTAEKMRDAITGMTQSLYHRGPDSGGLWIDKEAGMALGHRRLSIRDLSPLGHQPMVSPDGRYVLSYNGEIYNANEFIIQLSERGIKPKGTSDTEILLLSIMGLGFEATIENLLGMYAFAVWDRQERRITLVRDRFGVKPLYWSTDNGKRFLFASEPDALFYAGSWNPQIDMDSVALLLRYGYIPAPQSIWKNLFKLEAAHRLDIDANGNVTKTRYWNAIDVAINNYENPLTLDRQNLEPIVDEFDSLMTDAVRIRMVSDVPIGAFLSGGIDSSLVTALMQKCSPNPVRTFSIGFEEEGYNEAPFAAAIAKHLGTAHTELYIPAKSAWELIPEIPFIYGEPFADASQIPTTLLCRLAREYVTTALSGDGGDEFFAGYGRYASCLEQVPYFAPKTPAKSMLASLLRSLPASSWDKLVEYLPTRLRPRNTGSRLLNYADLNLCGTFNAYYTRYFMQYFWHPDTLLLEGKAPDVAPDHNSLQKLPPTGLMQLLDTSLYLADDILTKVDRASMSCSLEARVPLLDHRIFASAWRIPEAWRMKDGKGKFMMRQVLKRYVPEHLFERPKMGFGIPIGKWITGPLREWAEDMLDDKRLGEEKIFRKDKIREIWQRHKSGLSNWEYHLWIILMFQTWLERKFQKKAFHNSLPVVWS